MEPISIAALGVFYLSTRRSKKAPVKRSPTAPAIAEFIPAKYYRAGRAGGITAIVIHITNGRGDARATAEYFADPGDGRQVSAHYVIGREPSIFQCVAEQDVAFHAHRANEYSIGIEVSARTKGEFGKSDAGLPVTSEMYAATARLVAWLCFRYGLPVDRDHVLGHNEADPTTTHTKCPTGQWSWATFWPYLEEASHA